MTLLLRLNDEFDGIWTSCDLRRRFKSCCGGFSFYDHSDIMTKMVWSQGGHIKLRLLYTTDTTCGESKLIDKKNVFVLFTKI